SAIYGQANADTGSGYEGEAGFGGANGHAEEPKTHSPHDENTVEGEFKEV
ncbi:MAG: hypothetical protein JWO42_3831, partial [Chloroflexi bacterium]|nr:hypothetical protein [Chloroflexota bacterium]